MATVFERLFKGRNLVPNASSLNSAAGDLEVLSSDSRLYYHDGSTSAKVPTLTSSDTFTNKTIDGANNTLTVRAASDITGQLPVANGGTGLAAITAHDLIIGNGTSAATLLAPSATSGVALISQGSSSNPAYGTVVPAGGGTGLTSITAHNLMIGAGTSNATLLAPNSTSGIPLISKGSSADPDYGTAVVAGGGTGQVSLTAHGMIFGNGASAVTVLAPDASTTKVLVSGGSSADPAWGTVASGAVTTSTFTAPTISAKTSTGTQTGTRFVVSSANATAGATYTNNGQTFTVLQTISGATLLYTSGTGAAASGTLTKATGSGDSSITFSANSGLATYTTPTSPRVPVYLRVRVLGGGGGGGGSSTRAGADGGTGGIGGTSLLISATSGGVQLVCTGGSGGGVGPSAGGAGGSATATGGTVSGTTSNGVAGSGSGDADVGTGDTARIPGAPGGSSSWLGGAGPGGGGAAAGGNGQTNTGSGGGGAGGPNVQASRTGSGGGAGGMVDVIIPAPDATYYYGVGAGGAVGAAGTGPGFAGGLGGSGYIEITEYYQ